MSRERGITLVEVVVVGVLAAIVILALTVFYVNSQGTWVDASAQAITQREGSLLIGVIRDSVHAAASGSVSLGILTLRNHLGFERCHLWLDSTDSLLYIGTPSTPNQGPLVRSVATRFEVTADASFVTVTALELRSANRRLVQFSTSAAFLNQ